MSIPKRLSAAAFAAALAAIAGCSQAPPPVERPEIAPEQIPEFGYDVYTDLLHEFVDDNGMVDYAGMLERRTELDAFVASMGSLEQSEYDAWEEPAQIAFWINAYNAVTLQYILDHYPIKKGGLVSSALYPANSIRQIPGVWDKLTTPILGKDITLNSMEHDILRKDFVEPRLHVAIVCASIGCPPLRNEAFVPERLEEQLADQSRRFFSNPINLTVNAEKKSVALSSILKWFGKDFIPVYADAGEIEGLNEQDRSIANYAAAYANEEHAAFLRAGGYSVTFSDYDWSLNEQ